MADVIKVKAKKSYVWDQDKKFVYVQIPLPAHTTLAKLEIYLSDLILRVTTLQKKQTHFLDLLFAVDYRSPENKFIIANGTLHATLKKSDADLEWTGLLVEDISLADLKVRRRESEARYEQTVQQTEANKEKLRGDYDRKATQEMMRFEQEEREKLEAKKIMEKETAIREVFSGIDERTGKIEKLGKIQAGDRLEVVERVEEKWREKERIALQLLEKEEEETRKKEASQLKTKNENKIIEEVKKQFDKEKVMTQNNTMFTDEEIDRSEQISTALAEQFQEIPVRKANNQKVKFTERIYPHLAARDTFYKDPPMPKNKGGKGAEGDLEGKNPLWLKDRGDAFFKDKNYLSAIEAYTEAIKLDSKLLKAYLNRAASYMKLFKLNEAISDCDQCLQLLSLQIVGPEDEASSRLTLAKIKTRKGICLAWKGELAQAKEQINEASEIDGIDEEIKAQIKSCIAVINAREESIRHKVRGDEQVRLNNHQAALPHYQQSIETDENEYAVSNKILCLNKLKDYSNSATLAEKTIKRVSNFNIGVSITTKEDKQASIILLKLYYRRAKALEELGHINEAEQSIRKGLTINSEDSDLQEYLKMIKKKQSKEGYKKLKEATAQLIKQGKIKLALESYAKCLKLLEENEDIQEYLAILQNQCVCYQKLEQFDDVLSTCIRILKLVNNLESKILVFGDKKDTITIEKEDLKKISVRTLLRRANAYIQMAQYYNAKADLERALQLSPQEYIRVELEKLQEKLKTELQN